MNKQIIIFSLLIVLFLFSACKDRSKRTNMVLPYSVYSSFPPNWEEVAEKEKIFIAKFDGELYIFFSGQGESRFGIRDAKNKAQMNALLLAASAVKEVLKIQIIEAQKKIKKGRITQKIKEYIEQRVSESVNLSGLLAFKSKISRKHPENEKALFTVTMIYGLPKRLFLKRKKEALEKMHIKELLPTPNSRVGKTFL